MNPIVRKLLIALAIILLLALLVFAYIWHGNPSGRPIEDTMGLDPVLVEPEPRMIPSISFAEPIGWSAGQAPTAATGLTVARFAEGLDHPRTMLALPNGDILVAETNSPPREVSGFETFIMQEFLDRMGAGGKSPDRIVLLRDEDGNGTAEQRHVFREKDMVSPSGMAYRDGKLYIANHNAVLAFDFEPGPTKLEGNPKKLMDLPGGGNHWMRNLQLSPDRKSLFVAVGSSTNIAEKGMDAEAGRAAIWELNLETGSRRQFANGMRNPNGMDFNPSTGELWATVQERDQLGPDLVPDYLTNVPVGVQYGWPWVYWKNIFDDRVELPMPEFMLEYTRKPEYALGAHVGALGLLFSNGGNRMGEGYGNGAFVARHGSWNRKPAVAYDVIFVPYDANGNPEDTHQIVLSGFLTKDRSNSYGRPTWLAWDKDGALLVSDDTAGIIWRVIAPGAQPSKAPEAVVADSMPAQRDLDPNIDRKFKMKIEKDVIIEE